MNRLRKKAQAKDSDGLNPSEPIAGADELPAVSEQRKKVVQLPLGFMGLRLYMESRFVGMLIIAFIVYVFGALVANEWTYLMASGFVCAALTGAVIPLLILLDLKGESSLPGEVLSAEGTIVVVKLKRRNILGPLSWLIPAKWIRLTVDVVRRGRDGKTFERVFPPEPVLIESVEDEQWFEFPTPKLRRGVYVIKGLEVSTCFPLGIVWWSRTLAVRHNKKEVSITVYPKNYPMSGHFMEQLRGVSSTMGLASHASTITHQSTSFRSVREFKSGDSLRHVHWPSVARRGIMLVREFDQETIPVFDLVLNLRLPWKSQEQFELAVCTAMSLCHLGYSQGQLPTLLLNPPLDSKEMEALMYDLPEHVNQGVHLYSEILARVEPMSLRGVREEDTEMLDFNVVEKDVLTLLPSADSIIKYHPETGDTVCYPIELVIIPLGWDFDEDAYGADGAKGMTFATVRKSKARSQEDVKRALGPSSGEVVGRIEWEKDLEAL